MLPDVIDIAHAAGEDILTVYRQTELEVTRKADDSPLTQADLASHRRIVGRLRELTPDVPILSEESQGIDEAERSTWTRFWLVDPLDGTKEFVKRNGEFTVNIALIEDAVPVLGVVYAPDLGVSYYATRGQGAFKQQRGAQPERIGAASLGKGEALRLVASRSHMNAETEAFVAQLREQHPVEMVSIGSSLKLCLVAEGRAHLYPRFGPTMLWDTAAAQCVAEAAGAEVRDLSTGTPLRYALKGDLRNPFFLVHCQHLPDPIMQTLDKARV